MVVQKFEPTYQDISSGTLYNRVPLPSSREHRWYDSKELLTTVDTGIHGKLLGRRRNHKSGIRKTDRNYIEGEKRMRKRESFRLEKQDEKDLKAAALNLQKIKQN